MTDAIERKRRAIKARAASSSFPAEVEACEAALARLEERQPTLNVVRVKAELRPDPFGPRQTYRRPGPPAARALLPHQRKAWLLLASGGGNLSLSENSFLHRVRESKSISAAQSRFLDDIDTEEYRRLVEDYVLRGSGPTATDNYNTREEWRQENRVELEGERQGNREALLGQRQAGQRALKGVPTYRQANPAPRSGGRSGGGGGVREGQTATNPQTGAKVVYRGGKWVPAK